MATEEMHNCRQVKESAHLKENNTFLSYWTEATVKYIDMYSVCKSIYIELTSAAVLKLCQAFFYNSYPEA